MEVLPALRRRDGASGLSGRAAPGAASHSRLPVRGSARGASGAIAERGTFSGDRGRWCIGKSSLSLSLSPSLPQDVTASSAMLHITTRDVKHSLVSQSIYTTTSLTVCHTQALSSVHSVEPFGYTYSLCTQCPRWPCMLDRS